MRVAALDHVVLTVRDLDATVDFYERVLGMRSVTFAGGERVALRFGRQKLNLHELGNELLPNARESWAGTADLCFLVETPLEGVVDGLREAGVTVEHGPSDADGAEGPLRSVWLRDPDGNLVELANRVPGEGPADLPMPTSGARGEQLVWDGVDAWRAETATMALGATSLRAKGTQIGVEPLPYRLDYELEVDSGWLTRRLLVRSSGAEWTRRLNLRHDGAGAWTAEATEEGVVSLPPPGGEVAPVAGALDCDLGLCPLTNVMPVRRHELHLHAGAVDLLTAWVSVPDLGLHPSRQRYEHVARRDGGSVVRYVDASFTAELELDEEGFVVRYPGLARRVS